MDGYSDKGKEGADGSDCCNAVARGPPSVGRISRCAYIFTKEL